MNAARMNHLRQVLEQDPKNTFARYALGMELVSNGQTDEAVANFRTLLEVDANYVNAWFMGAQALHNAGRTPEAIEWLHKASPQPHAPAIATPKAKCNPCWKSWKADSVVASELTTMG